MIDEHKPYPIDIIKDIRVKICQYSNRPKKSVQVKITHNAAYIEFTSRLVLMLTYFENEVKQLAQNVTNNRFSSIVKNEMNRSSNNENKHSLR